MLSCQNPDVIEKWEAGTGIVIRDGYGQSETVSKIFLFFCVLDGG